MWRWRNDSLAVRALRTEDAAHCAGLHAQGFRRGWSTGEFASFLNGPSVLGDAAWRTKGGALAGFVMSRRAEAEAEILTIVVDPKRRGKGIGAELMRTHLGRLAAAGVVSVFLEVDERNSAALSLYARFGFERVGERPAYYSRDDGTRAGARILRCVL